jgi:hypothetical protein
VFRPSVKTLSLGLAALACLPFGSVANAGIINWVTVGDAGNTADTAPSGYGAVATSFQIMSTSSRTSFTRSF